MKLTIKEAHAPKLVTLKDFPPNTLGRIHKWPASTYNDRVVAKIPYCSEPNPNNITYSLVDLSSGAIDCWAMPLPFDNDINQAAIEILPAGTEVVLTQD